MKVVITDNVGKQVEVPIEALTVCGTRLEEFVKKLEELVSEKDKLQERYENAETRFNRRVDMLEERYFKKEKVLQNILEKL